MSYFLRLLFALFLLCAVAACQPDPPDRAPDGQYVAIDLPDSLRMSGDPRFTEQRIIVAGDSAYYFHPRWGSAAPVPIFQGDTLAVRTDSLYVVYDMVDDSTISVRNRLPDTTFSTPQFYRLRPPHTYVLPGPAVSGKTYAYEVEGVPMFVHFRTPDLILSTLQTREGYTDRPVELRGSRLINYPDSQQINRISYVERVGENQVLTHRLLVTADRAGTPQLDLLVDERRGKWTHRGPFTGEVYPSPVPDSVPDYNLFMQLSRGRMEVADIPPPDAPASLADRRPLFYDALIPAKIRRVGLEFREDGYFSVFLSDRILTEGEWTLTEDRNFIILKAQRQYGDHPSLMTAYTDDYLAFTLPLLVKRELGRPYLADVVLRFYAP
jgi:hypothetical protein